MTFEIRDLPSGLLFKGQLVQKKITAKSRRQLILCFVNTVQDIAELYEYLKYPSAIGDGSYSQNFADPTSLKDMEVYGHLTLAAVVRNLN